MAEQKGVGGAPEQKMETATDQAEVQGDKGPAWPVTYLIVRTNRKV